MGVRKSELTTYYRQIRKTFPASRKMRCQLISDLRESINEYQIEHPSVGMDEIRRRFGTPEEIAASAMEQMSPARVGRRLFRMRIALCVVGTLMIIVFVIK